MNRERARLLAALVRELRTPLARVALAAGELEATAREPAQRALAGRIEAALRAADGGIERVLALLDEPGKAAAQADACQVIASLRMRVEPALGARGIGWREPAIPEDPVALDAERLRRGALCLLRAGARALSEGGWLRLSPLRRGPRAGLELECRDAPGSGLPRLESLELQAGAAAVGGWLELLAEPEGSRARLWLDA